MTRRVTPKGRKFIGGWEKKVLVAYRDGGGVLTIGYGHTTAAGGMKVTAGLKITDQQAEALFTQDLAVAERTVERLTSGVELTDNQFDTLVDFVHNVGPVQFANSTLLKRVQAKRFKEVPGEFMKWIYDNGVVVKGLRNRRKAEVALWNGTMQPKTKKVLTAIGTGIATTGTGAGAVAETTGNTDIMTTVEPVMSAVSMFGMSGSTILAAVGGVAMLGLGGFLIYRMVRSDAE